jgi:hypothetical protein
MAQVVECLLSKHQVLSSNTSTAKKKKRNIFKHFTVRDEEREWEGGRKGKHEPALET